MISGSSILYAHTTCVLSNCHLQFEHIFGSGMKALMCSESGMWNCTILYQLLVNWDLETSTTCPYATNMKKYLFATAGTCKTRNMKLIWGYHYYGFKSSECQMIPIIWGLMSMILLQPSDGIFMYVRCGTWLQRYVLEDSPYRAPRPPNVCHPICFC